MRHLFKGSVVQQLVNNSRGIDVLVASFGPGADAGAKRAP